MIMKFIFRIRGFAQICTLLLSHFAKIHFHLFSVYEYVYTPECMCNVLFSLSSVCWCPLSRLVWSKRGTLSHGFQFWYGKLNALLFSVQIYQTFYSLRYEVHPKMQPLHEEYTLKMNFIKRSLYMQVTPFLRVVSNILKYVYCLF
jgi:hypothetical protein